MPMKHTLILAALFFPIAAQAGDTSVRDLKKSIADIDKTLADADRNPSLPLGQSRHYFGVTPHPLPRPSILLQRR